MGNNKTDVQCLHRWQKVLNPQLVKGPWSAEVSQIFTYVFIHVVCFVAHLTWRLCDGTGG